MLYAADAVKPADLFQLLDRLLAGGVACSGPPGIKINHDDDKARQFHTYRRHAHTDGNGTSNRGTFHLVHFVKL